MRNFRLTLSYDGTDFHGWQTQPGFRTVQEVLETAMSRLTNGQRVRVNASGRTDTGVHAVGQVANAFLDTTVPLHALAKAINAHLPEDVIVREIEEAPQSFDANRDAVASLPLRHPRWPGPRPVHARYCHHSRRELDAAAMARAAEPFPAGTISTASRPTGPIGSPASAPSSI